MEQPLILVPKIERTKPTKLESRRCPGPLVRWVTVNVLRFIAHFRAMGWARLGQRHMYSPLSYIHSQG